MSEPAKTWLEWIESDDGKRCADHISLGITPKMGEYLKNRLWHAFVAGMTAQEVNPLGADKANDGIPQSGQK